MVVAVVVIRVVVVVIKVAADINASPSVVS
jgi:hypothetical protein